MKTQLYFLFSLFFILNVTSASAQEAAFDDEGIAREMVLEEAIKSIRLYREGWLTSYPIMTMYSGVPLTLDFDELSDFESSFSYTFIHCDADWQQSELFDQEYMSGYPINEIKDFESSFNTYYNFTHYKLSIPNDDVQLTQSGNYLLVVFRNNDPDEIVFTRRFLISEAAITIKGEAKRPILTEYRDNSHEIDINIDHSSYRIDDPYRETTLSIFQNGVWDNNISNLDPLFVNPGELIYDYQKENIFKAGNEFRVFSTKTDNVRGLHIKNIEYIPPYMHFELKDDEVAPAHLYFEREDINGRMFIQNDRGDDADLDADYVYVHFTLKMPFPIDNSDVYIAGELNNWQFNGLNKMTYDNTEGAYHASLLLKQGIYNYRYIVHPHDSNKFNIEEIEGSHYETENEYLILFYHQGQRDRYDRLIGHEIIQSK